MYAGRLIEDHRGEITNSRCRGDTVEPSQIDILVIERRNEVGLQHVFKSEAGNAANFGLRTLELSNETECRERTAQIDVAVRNAAREVRHKRSGRHAYPAPERAVPVSGCLRAGEIGRAWRGRRVCQSIIHRAYEVHALEVRLKPKNHCALLPIVTGMPPKHSARRISGICSRDRAEDRDCRSTGRGLVRGQDKRDGQAANQEP